MQTIEPARLKPGVTTKSLPAEGDQPGVESADTASFAAERSSSGIR